MLTYLSTNIGVGVIALHNHERFCSKRRQCKGGLSYSFNRVKYQRF
jgi:hypothetical protein